MTNNTCVCGHAQLSHRDKNYDADVSGSVPGLGSCTECDTCTEYRPADQLVERAVAFWRQEAGEMSVTEAIVAFAEKELQAEREAREDG